MQMTAENRAEGRSNVFLTATLDSGATPTPVRIRNLSARGALIDGTSLPPVGARVRLTRGKHTAVGELTWAGPGQGGVNFDREIDVASWVQRVGHGGQERVDGVIASIRSTGAVPSDLADDAAPESLPVISSALDQVCERLARIPGMSLELGEELIKLDTIAQSLRRLVTGRPY
jgi:hypothetical protein